MSPIDSPLGRGWLTSLLALAALTGVRPDGAAGQAGPAVLGAAGGFVAGLYTTTAIYVTEARFGHYIFSVDEVVSISPEIVPIVVTPVAGAWLGLESGTALGRAALWGGAGFLAGAALGAGTGHLAWRTPEGRWAGAIIGSAIGMLTGAALGARDGLEDGNGDEGPPAASFMVSIPLGRSR